MSKKQKAVAFEFFSYAIIFIAAFGLWVMLQSLSLVYPQSVQASSYERPIGRVVLAPAKIDDSEIAKLVEKQIALQKVIDDFTVAQNGVYSIYVASLDGGISAKNNADAQLDSASLYKLFAAQLAYEKVDSYEWSLSESILGTKTLNDCLDIMITVSDNDCGKAIVKKLGYSNVNAEAMKALGYPKTDLGGEYTKSSATDVAKLLRDLYEGNLVSQNSSKSFLGFLAAQKINDRLPQGLPDGVQILHKTGDLSGYMHDGGIVRFVDGSGYIIVVMSGPDPSQKTSAERYEKFAELSKSVYEIINY